MREIVAAAGTSVGMKRDHNEDLYLVQAPADDALADEKGWLLIVVDGMGGHASGEVAARLVVDNLASTYLAAGDADPAEALVRGLVTANAAVRERAATDEATAGMGATCVAAALRGDQLITAHVGDCRAYLRRGGQLQRLTSDHSFVAQLVRDHVINEEEAMNHPRRNLVTRAVGKLDEVEPEIGRFTIEAGDLILLCSDGLCGVVPDEQLALLLGFHQDLEKTVLHLIDAANAAGGPDNVTVVVAQVG
jgi:protein phosphatase